ncbi:hypothetical protein QMK19_34530 [Streptomyces sp. H10-C2]|uniref:hypothetical protein n=1 Tax=unclassified Streptomyces TaxID=2593676 RepID=UPI0024BB9900|nr:MULTISPECIES: hypothetical protein [unclassified Streptomyces]MDJ0346696.1 hypothetical protein [Streptomyces sp. PH10-H1]MDJ0374604.1 hypothetical protein [Streptomyces sp. H10-C2]
MRKIRRTTAPGRYVALLLSLGTCAALAGCDTSSGSPEGVAERPVSAVGTPNTAVDLRLPLDDYMLDEFEGYKLSELLRARMTACMKEFGHISFSLPPAPSPAVAVHNERRYGITDAKLASERGYRVPEKTKPQVSSEPSLSPAESFALTGGSTHPGEFGQGGSDQSGKPVPPGGCAGRANEALGYGSADAPGNPQLVQSLDRASFDQSLQDARVKSALSRWSVCMKKAGYTYPAEPFSASNDLDFTGPTVGEKEKAVAVADVTCKNSSGLIRDWKVVETALQEKLIAEGGTEIAQVKTQTAAVRANIKQLAP